jgi:folate-dependent phosphoribosylglycinamide formyltransferase PurN
MKQRKVSTNEPLRLVLLANDDPSSNHIFKGAFDAGQGVEVVCIAYSKTLTGRRGRFGGALNLIFKMDVRYWLYLIFWNGVFALGEFLQLRAYPMHRTWSLKPMCRRLKIPIMYSKNFNSEKFVHYLKELKPDLIVTRANQILRKRLLKIPRFGVWCCHSSLLPSYQGIAGEFHALLNGENYIGTTIFQVEEKLDKGPNLFQVSIPIKRGQSVYRHTLRNNEAARRLLSSSVAKLSQERQNPKVSLSNLNLNHSYYSWPAPGTVYNLSKLGHKLINIKEIFSHINRCLFNFELKNSSDFKLRIR